MGPVLLNMILNVLSTYFFSLGSTHHILPPAVTPEGFYGSSLTIHINKAPWVSTHTLSMYPSSPSKEPLTQQAAETDHRCKQMEKENKICTICVMASSLGIKAWRIQM